MDIGNHPAFDEFKFRRHAGCRDRILFVTDSGKSNESTKTLRRSRLSKPPRRLMDGRSIPMKLLSRVLLLGVSFPMAVGGAAMTGCLTFANRAPSHIPPGPWAGPMAEKHAGEVVFSSAPIPMDGKDDSAAYATYTLGDPLFMRFWSKDSPNNLQPCEMRSLSGDFAVRQVTLHADINGEGASKPIAELPSFDSYGLSEDDSAKRQMKGLSNELERAFTTPSTFGGDRASRDDAVRNFNAYIVPKLHEGENTLRIVVALSCVTKPERTVLAEGSIKVRVVPGAKEAYLAKYATKVPPSPHPENDRLARDIVAAMKKKPDWDSEVLVGASVTSEAWQPVRHPDTGVLIAQEIEALLFVRKRSEKDPENCRAFHMHYRRDPAGGTLYYSGTGSSTFVPCSAAPR